MKNKSPLVRALKNVKRNRPVAKIAKATKKPGDLMYQIILDINNKQYSTVCDELTAGIDYLGECVKEGGNFKTRGLFAVTKMGKGTTTKILTIPALKRLFANEVTKAIWCKQVATVLL